MRLRYVAAIVVSTALLATGCGAAEKLSPRVAVREALKETASQKEGTFKLSLVGSEADLNALFNKGAPLSEEDRRGLNLLRNGHIAVSTGSDKFALDIKAGDLEHALELRYVDKKLYARADVAGLAKLFGASPEEFNEAVSGLASQEGFEFLAAAAAGKWLEADFTTLKGMFEGLGKQFGLEDAPSSGQESTPAQSGDTTAPGQYQAIKDAVGKVLSEDVSVEKLKSDDIGDHYLAKVASLQATYAKLRPIFEQHMAKTPYGSALPTISAVPDKPGSFDVWVKDGRVPRVELDLAQLEEAPPAGLGRVALRLDIDREAVSVTPPSDAVPVDIAGLIGRFVSQFGGFLQGMGGGLSNYD